MHYIILHSIILTFTVACSFLLSKTALSAYDLQLTALLFVMYFIVKKFVLNHRFLDSIVFTLIIMNIVLSTGGVNSSLFFLIYFLIFALALILEPAVSMTTSLSIMLFFLLEVYTGRSLESLLPVFSLPFLTPFALFLGKEYQKTVKQRTAISQLKKDQETKANDNIMFLSLVIKTHLDAIQELADNFMGDYELEKIKGTVRRLQKLISKYESEL